MCVYTKRCDNIRHCGALRAVLLTARPPLGATNIRRTREGFRCAQPAPSCVFSKGCRGGDLSNHKWPAFSLQARRLEVNCPAFWPHFPYCPAVALRVGSSGSSPWRQEEPRLCLRRRVGLLDKEPQPGIDGRAY